MMAENDKIKRLEILLIEDDEDDAELIEKSLAPGRYRITNVWNGKKAVDYLVNRDNDIDVVLLDKGLPYKTGLEVLKETRESGKEYAFIFLTVDSTVETAVEAMKLGALDFLPKGSGFEGLPEMIEKVYKIHSDRLERRKIENYLKESEEKYRTLVENADDFIYLIDKEYKVLSLNTAAARIFWKKPEEVIGKTIFNLFPENIAKGYSKDIKKVLESGKGMSADAELVVGDK